ncbi:DNA repair protein RecN [Nocardioides sp. CFH 31398]|uniref:DNA repair protein RecN n=1 Tax=Nocardioides sp. CFH 31398 TaxID=2919579 RepID=UPI001F057C4B|nr:DNA repair protein RecN [Nocardioides sp. CFH 31398]MCH1867035.1 DNA repair protein RecN [Nocardioides sp. CFH 31398]
MFEEIRIGGLGVIESSTLELGGGPGLTVITGETGAGKTMVVTALGLLLGGRADSGAVRAGRRSARVEGLVRTDATPGLADEVEEAGGEVEEQSVLLARTISAEGRSRAFVGGAAVPASVLARLAEPLVAVHGQSDQHRLLRASAQREALDRFGATEVAEALGRWRVAHADLVATEQQLAEVLGATRERAREAETLREALARIEEVAPVPGEDAALAAEEARLGHAEELRTAAEQAREALSSDSGGADAVSTVGAARSLLDSVRDHDAEAAGLADRAAEVGYLLSDLASDVASYATGLDVDPARLAAVSERRAALTDLTRRYAESLDEVLAWAERGSRRLLELDGTDDEIEALRAHRDELRDELAVTGARLSALREEAAVRLAAEVTEELTRLAMPHAVVELRVTQNEAQPPPAGVDPGPGAPLWVGERWLAHTASGLDEVEILLAANTGASARPLHKGASGGELSRVMLALEVSLAGTSPVPTFVFDEVDAGVGGRAAVEVGRRLARLARTAQVLVVTHLPQVAAFADRHVVVEKASDGSVTTSGLTVLAESDRERELSRMLAGVDDSDSALAHARELLESARSTV